MTDTGLVSRLLSRGAVAAFMTVLAACGGGGDGAPLPAQPVSLSIGGLPRTAMLPGQSAQLTATLTYSDTSTRDVTETAAWSSTDAGVFTVSSTGMILAVASGQAEAVASAQGLTSGGIVNVARPAPPRLALFVGTIGGRGNADGVGADARFSSPSGVATDREGNVYVADTGNRTIRKITREGAVSTFAGKAGISGSADGIDTEARFYRPSGIATDSFGNIFVADNSAIRKITPDGMVSTLAGVVDSWGSVDGTGTEARFSEPQGIATDSIGNIYVADTYNHTVRKVTPAGVVSTLAGEARSTGSADGTGVEARFDGPYGIAADSAGNLYVADTGNSTIRKITPDGIVSTLAGKAGVGGSADGIGAAARFGGPSGIATDSFGNIFVAGNYTIRKITPDGVVSTLAGKVASVGSEDGVGADARFAGPRGVATDSFGNVYVADEGNHTIRKITSAGNVSTLAGSPEKGGSVDGIGAEARFNLPSAIAQNGEGNLYVSDSGNHTIRTITPAGAVSTLAGTAGETGSADGVGAQARFYFPTGVAADKAGNVYVVDSSDNRIRRISPAGVVSTLAGSGVVGSADGDGATASFRICFKEFDFRSAREQAYCGHAGLATDAAGNVYVTDIYNHTIRKIDPAGRVSTLAGTARSPGGIDGIGAQARFSRPAGIATDSLGNVYVADTGNLTIRKITPDGTVSTLAGAAGQPGSADGNGKDARFGTCQSVPLIGISCVGPAAIAIGGAGDLYVADAGNVTIRKVTPAGVVTTVVGVAGANEFVPGALPASLTYPYGVAVVGTSLFITMPNGVAVVTNVP